MQLDAGYFREEPGAGKPHARICEGEAEWISYSTIPQTRGPSILRPVLESIQVPGLVVDAMFSTVMTLA